MIAYVLESTFILGLFYSLFFLLKNENSFRFNRFFILGSLISAIILPFISLPFPGAGAVSPATVMLEELVITAEAPLKAEGTRWPYYWLALYGVITLIMGSHLLVQLFHLRRLKKRNKYEQKTHYALVALKGTQTHFSFFNTIFINTAAVDDDQDLQRIVRHEEVHVRQKHSADVLMLELVKVFCWFNPFVWLFKPLMMYNHEFLADQRVVLQGADKATYMHQIVKHTLSNYNVALVNNFNYSLTKKRVIMMTKQKSKWLSAVKIATILPLAAGITFIFSCTENAMDRQENKSVAEQNMSDIQEETVVTSAKPTEDNSEIEEETFMVVEEMPEFEGGEPGEFRYFIAKNVAYPKAAKEQSIEGKVFVQFLVGSDGKVKNAEVVRGVHPLLDAEAIRVVNLSPKWTPGVQRGEKVAVQFTFPINFKLQ